MEPYAELDIARHSGVLSPTESPKLRLDNVAGNTITYYQCIPFQVKGFEAVDIETDQHREESYYTVSPKLTSVDLYCNREAKPFYNGEMNPEQIYEGVVDKASGQTSIKWRIPITKEGDLVYWQGPTYQILGVRTNKAVEITDERSLTDDINELFTSYVWIQHPEGKFLINIRLIGNFANEDTLLHRVNIGFEYSITKHYEYYDISENTGTLNPSKSYSISFSSGDMLLPIFIDTNSINRSGMENTAKKALVDKIIDNTCVQFYTHGRAGNYTEMNYFDQDPTNQIQPTKWYGKQEPFEFEFVVNSNAGMQKVFDNISIISNNAEPDSIECTLIGDSYGFNKRGIYEQNAYFDIDLDKEFEYIDVSQNFNVRFGNIVFNTKISKDETLNQYALSICSKLRDISKHGRRLGNMNYLEDKWNITLDPIYFKTKYKIKSIDSNQSTNDSKGASYEIKESPVSTAKLRDK